MHEHEARALGFELTYRKIDFTKPRRERSFLAAMIDAAESMGFAGLNVTHPFKRAVVPLLTDLSEDARAIGSVNTIVFKEGRRFGYNTDWIGFRDNFLANLPDAGLERVTLLGAGGAGSAVAYAVLRMGTRHLTLFDIDAGRAGALASSLQNQFADRRIAVANEVADALGEADGLIQATPVGMLGHPGMPVPASALRPQMWVAEIVYFPAETELLQAATRCGCRVVTGGGMAVRQAAAAFASFFGAQPDVGRMLRDFEESRKTVPVSPRTN